MLDPPKRRTRSSSRKRAPESLRNAEIHNTDQATVLPRQKRRHRLSSIPSSAQDVKRTTSPRVRSSKFNSTVPPKPLQAKKRSTWSLAAKIAGAFVFFLVLAFALIRGAVQTLDSIRSEDMCTLPIVRDRSFCRPVAPPPDQHFVRLIKLYPKFVSMSNAAADNLDLTSNLLRAAMDFHAILQYVWLGEPSILSVSNR